MAMLPFCGYNMGDYWNHWIKMGTRSDKMPLIFHVNWFRQDASGRFLWPGFGENLRVLQWVLDRVKGRGLAVETPIGYVPAQGALSMVGLDVSAETMRELLSVENDEWKGELSGMREFFQKFGDRLPVEMTRQADALERRLGA
jgi:phosphoenolpyruvate carboxykinase (GTP)